MDPGFATAVCESFSLGELNQPPTRVLGGLLHQVFRVETKTGVYALKVLNLAIMQRAGVAQSLVRSEHVARLAVENKIPAIVAIGEEHCLHCIQGQYCLVYPWVRAQSVKAHEVSQAQSQIVGEILALLHRTDFSPAGIPFEAPKVLESNWGVYDAFLGELGTSIDEIKTWERRANRAVASVQADLVISHRDMDCKNILWEDKTPYIIDWEAAGTINPMQDLMEVAFYWSGADTHHFRAENFQAVVAGYLGMGGVLAGDLGAAMEMGFRGRLGWLEYNIRRGMGLEGSGQGEQELGTGEAQGALKALRLFEQRLELDECTQIMKRDRLFHPRGGIPR